MENNSWVKIYRKFLEWEWYDDINTKVLFLHILLKANFKEKKWRGVTIKRGQHITGRFVLSKETGLSEQQVRTSLDKLISTNEITKSSTPTYTILTINNYDKYQTNNQEDNQRATNEQPSSNQVVTTPKESKKDRKIEIDIPVKKKVGYEREAKILLSGYNKYFNKKFKNIQVWYKNYVYWRKTYAFEEIQDAILNAKNDNWWKDKLTLEKLFRTRNKNGECDYIGELLNK